MLRFIDIQDKLDHILGTNPSPNHGSFWRGVTRNEFVNLSVYGMKLIIIGDPEASNLIRALRGLPPFGSDLNPRPSGAIIARMPKGGPPASKEDITAIEQWIIDGCPDTEEAIAKSLSLAESSFIDDDVHVRYWRAVDDFFLPGLATPEAAKHVGRMHMPAFQTWIRFALNNEPLKVWTDYLTDNKKSFEFVRLHQRRLLTEFYNGSQDAYFDSIWKFGATLLPLDPLSHALPEHRMNGISDWFIWIAHLDATLRASDISELDLVMARGWQVGLIADGLLRKDEDRPISIPIGDFNSNDSDLQSNVFQAFANADADALKDKMLKRRIEANEVL